MYPAVVVSLLNSKKELMDGEYSSLNIAQFPVLGQPSASLFPDSLSRAGSGHHFSKLTPKRELMQSSSLVYDSCIFLQFYYSWHQ